MLMSDLVFAWLRLGEQHKCRVRKSHTAKKVLNTLIFDLCLLGVGWHLPALKARTTVACRSSPEGSSLHLRSWSQHAQTHRQFRLQPAVAWQQLLEQK